MNCDSNTLKKHNRNPIVSIEECQKIHKFGSDFKKRYEKKTWYKKRSLVATMHFISTVRKKSMQEAKNGLFRDRNVQRTAVNGGGAVLWVHYTTRYYLNALHELNIVNST